MLFLFLFSFIEARKIIEYPELEKRKPDDICQEYKMNYDWRKTTSCYIPGEGCKYGTHSAEDLLWTTKRVNFYRKLVGLATIPQTKNQEYLNYVNQATLVMEKNNKFEHHLDNKSFLCWSEAAQKGARYSNIFWSGASTCSTDSIPSYISDSNTPSLGHRRWILDPPLKEVVAGLCSHYSALMVMMPEAPNPVPIFTAYPPPGPVPYDVIYNYWSFSRKYNYSWDIEHNKMPDDTKVRVKCNNSEIKIKQTLQESNSANYAGIVSWEGGRLTAGTYCKVVITSDSADTEWRYTVQAIKCVNGKAQNVNADAFTDDYTPSNCNSSGKKQLGAGTIAGIVIVVILAVVIIVIGVAIFLKKRKENRKEALDSRLIAV